MWTMAEPWIGSAFDHMSVVRDYTLLAPLTEMVARESGYTTTVAGREGMGRWSIKRVRNRGRRR